VAAVAVLALGVAVGVAWAAASGGYSLVLSAIAPRGASSGGSYALVSAIGQPEAGSPSGGKYLLVAGMLAGGNPTVTPTPTGGRVYLPEVLVHILKTTLTPTPTPIIQNGSFEMGLKFWTIGGSLHLANGLPAVQATGDPAYPSEGNTALLGNPGYACLDGVPDGEAYVAQTVTLPTASAITLTFFYDVWTQNVEYTSSNQVIDSFDVWVNQPNLVDPSVNGTLLFRDGYQQTPGSGGAGCGNAPNEVHNSATVDLTAYRGQTITLYFANYHRGITSYNTYTYLDDVAISVSRGAIPTVVPSDTYPYLDDAAISVR
jgi:hypothetical protein